MGNAEYMGQKKKISLPFTIMCETFQLQ